MKTDIIRLRVQSEEKQAFQDAADIAGMTLSAWVRERLRRAARRELEEAGKKIAFLQTGGTNK